MKRLSKKVNSLEHTIEAYACSCGSECSAYCGCTCAFLFGDKNGARDDSSAKGYLQDSAAEERNSNYRK